jgi:hypothetical protein
MGQSSLNLNADGADQDAEPGANPMPGSAGERDSSSIQSPNFQLAAASNPAGDAEPTADATRTDASSGGNPSSDAQPNPSVQSDPSQDSQSALTLQQPSVTTPDSGDALTQPTASGAAPAPRQRQAAKQIGQIPIIDDARMHKAFTGPAPETAAQAQEQHMAWMQMAQQSQAQWQQIAQINQSDPYISDDDGRWKKQTVDPITGAIHETDILDAESGKIDRGSGDIYVQTSQGPQFIGVDPHQKQQAQIIDQKTQAQAPGSPIDANIAAAKSALLDTQQQLQTFHAQTALNDWKQQNPRYTELSAQRDALANQIQTQIAAKAQSHLQVAQLLTAPQYVQWNDNTPPSPYAGRQIAAAPDGSAPASDLSIHDVDSRAGVIAAQTGFPAGLAYVAALGEAKQLGAQTLDWSSIDDAIKGIQPVVEAQLLKMTPQQLRQAFQSRLITRQQVQATVMGNPDRSGQDQPAAAPDNGGQTADPLAQSVADLTARAADLRTKIQSAFDTGGADGAKDLATYRAALADTESELHAATQTLVNRVPAVIQQRIVKAVAPDLDWDAATQQSTQDPMAHFATENLGSALRDQDIPPDLQQRIRQLAMTVLMMRKIHHSRRRMVLDMHSPSRRFRAWSQTLGNNFQASIVMICFARSNTISTTMHSSDLIDNDGCDNEKPLMRRTE